MFWIMFTCLHIPLIPSVFQFLLANRNEATAAAEVNPGNLLGLNYVIKRVDKNCWRELELVYGVPGQNFI